jgi:hypothetical protein
MAENVSPAYMYSSLTALQSSTARAQAMNPARKMKLMLKGERAMIYDASNGVRRLRIAAQGMQSVRKNYSVILFWSFWGILVILAILYFLGGKVKETDRRNAVRWSL